MGQNPLRARSPATRERALPRATGSIKSADGGLGLPPRDSFAEKHGATALIAAGTVLILAAAAAVLVGRSWISLGSVAAVGLLALALGALLSQMEGRFKILGLSGTLRPNVGQREIEGPR